MVHVRPAVLADLDVLVASNVAIARETEQVTLDPELVVAGVEAILRDETRGQYYVAERDGSVVGQVLITREWSDWRCGYYWWIQSVYVSPSARRIGVYRTLHQDIERRARKAGALALKLYVDRDNARARSTYEALGLQRSEYDLYEVALPREQR